MTERRLAIVRNGSELQRALRDRAEELQLSRSELDRLSGLLDGYSSKLLCDPPMKQITADTLFPLAGAMRVAVVLVEDPQAAEHLKNQPPRDTHKVRRGTEHWRNAKASGLVREIMQQHGLKGGRARFATMSPTQLAKHQSKASRARWRAWRRMRKTANGRRAE